MSVALIFPLGKDGACSLPSVLTVGESGIGGIMYCCGTGLDEMPALALHPCDSGIVGVLMLLLRGLVMDV